MLYWITFYCVLVLVCAQPSDNEDNCIEKNCVGEEYKCLKGRCICADGYIPNYFMIRCVRCPGLGEKCFGPCCPHENATLHCWQGICQPCYDHLGNGICREPMDQLLVISTTHIVMGAVLILGIIATFILLYKLCAVNTLRPLGRSNNDSRLSIGSLQLYVEERLRDAPPRYSRAPDSRSAVYPPATYLNPGFVHEYNIPPPPYTPERKNEDTQNPTLHM